MEEFDEFYINSEYRSECCGALIYGEVIDGIGICSHCNEWSGVQRNPDEDPE